MSRNTSVKLGADSYELVPQPWVYLQHEIREFGAQITDLEGFDLGDVDNVVASLGDRAYEFLLIFIPDLMPKHRFMGFRSADAMEEGTYDPEAARKAPTFADIVESVELAFRVNRLDVLSRLKALFPLDLIQRELRTEMANRLTAAASNGKIESPSSPSLNGTSDSTPSTPPSPTPAAPPAPANAV